MTHAPTTAAFTFSADDHAQLAAWVAPRAPYGFHAVVTELEEGGGEVALVFTPGRPQQFHAMVSGGVRGAATVSDEEGNETPVEGMACALEAIALGLLAGCDLTGASQ